MGRTRRGGTAAAVAVLVGVVSPASPVAAHDHRVPTASLSVADETQRGRRLNATWVSRFDEESCDVKSRTGRYDFPRAVNAVAGHPATIRIAKASAPREITVEAWAAVDESGVPSGESRPVPFVLLPVIGYGAVTAWEVVFWRPPAERHAYVVAHAYWADEEGCAPQPDLGTQYVSWMFHVRLP